MTQIFGHRGSAGTHPENTMMSFQEAERVGADGIELDVQLSKDGEMVIIHDEKVDRTTDGKGWVKDLTLKELRQLDASYKFSYNERCIIPSLEELFSWASPNSLLINVELKNTVVLYEGLEEKVIQLIRNYHMENRVIISSFNHYSLVKCRNIAPDIEIGALYSDGLFEPWHYATRIGAGALHPNYKAAPPEIISQSQLNGIKMRPYTVNKVEDMKKLFSVNCSGFFTDFPERAVLLKPKNRPQ
ncbi:glycerophosphodiester phosphodiesterase [Bacillus salitolerans]|uniref:Glycerophosphodiester phosphodiesterase n=1 Tax=Bacillus salitolerans TaxID=1437434 RepID=A0ABW4LNB0_9BACI